MLFVSAFHAKVKLSAHFLFFFYEVATSQIHSLNKGEQPITGVTANCCWLLLAVQLALLAVNCARTGSLEHQGSDGVVHHLTVTSLDSQWLVVVSWLAC